MKINAIIAGMPYDQNMVDMTARCITGFRQLVDKITFIQNGVFDFEYPAEMLDLVDTYIRNKKNRLHAGAINQGALLAQDYEYLAFINDDITPNKLDRLGFESLCAKGEMRSPQLLNAGHPQHHSFGAHASFWVTDKPTFMKIGLWRLDLGHTADMEHFTKAKDMGVTMLCMNSLTVNHDHPAATISRTEPPHFLSNEI